MSTVRIRWSGKNHSSAQHNTNTIQHDSHGSQIVRSENSAWLGDKCLREIQWQSRRDKCSVTSYSMHDDVQSPLFFFLINQNVFAWLH